jgi:hypothetical protein
MYYHIPQVTLDATLASYYAEGNKAGTVVVLVASFCRGLYRHNQRYIYQEDDMTTLEETNTPEYDLERAKMTRIFRDLNSQKYSFCAGDMPVILFHQENTGEADQLSMDIFRNSMESILEVLHPSQRPDIIIYGQPAEVKLKGERMKLAVRLPLDELRDHHKHAHVIDPDLHYQLLSKRGLALAKDSFPTPHSQFFDLCCEHPECKQDLLRGAVFCRKFPSEEELDEWYDKTIKSISALKVPFVLKAQQSAGSHGTFIVKTEQQHGDLIAKLPALLKYNRVRTNKKNIHLRPATLIVSDLVNVSTGGRNNWGLTFFVMRDGSVGYIGCGEQDMDEQNLWLGASITFSHQDEYQERFAEIMSNVCIFLHRQGYYGPVGIDVLEDVDGKLWVVDMNVRPPGSLVLGLLRSFLEKARGFDYARIVAIKEFNINRDALYAKFANEFSEGRIILNAWVDDEETRGGWATLVIAGENKAAVNTLSSKLEDG